MCVGGGVSSNVIESDQSMISTQQRMDSKSVYHSEFLVPNNKADSGWFSKKKLILIFFLRILF